MRPTGHQHIRSGRPWKGVIHFKQKRYLHGRGGVHELSHFVTGNENVFEIDRIPDSAAGSSVTKAECSLTPMRAAT
jgi:hypothetical protein